jgi:DNA-binding NarL/FixJ family response regulator
VLVVDDSRFVRATIVRALRGDFELQQAECGERAWELLLLDPSIGVVLSDLTMPGMDGFELLRRVRESVLPRIRSLPFAVLSGADEPAQRKRAADLGADRFVVKGDGFDELNEWIGSRLREGTGRTLHASDVAQADVQTHTQADSRSDAQADAVPAVVLEAAASAPSAPSAAAPDARPDAESEAQAAAVIAEVRAALAAEAPTTVDSSSAATNRGATTDEATVDQLATATSSTTEDAAVDARLAGASGDRAAVQDPLQRWFLHQLIGLTPGSGEPVLIRLHAPNLDDLPSRLRRGVRAADALHQDGPDTAWLFVTAAAPIALKLAFRFGLLAAGRSAAEPGSMQTALVSMLPVDVADPTVALAGLRAMPMRVPPAGRVAVECGAGAWGAPWRFDVPWAAARLLIG